jgi:hypothetical protein
LLKRAAYADLLVRLAACLFATTATTGCHAEGAQQRYKNESAIVE